MKGEDLDKTVLEALTVLLKKYCPGISEIEIRCFMLELMESKAVETIEAHVVIEGCNVLQYIRAIVL